MRRTTTGDGNYNSWKHPVTGRNRGRTLPSELLERPQLLKKLQTGVLGGHRLFMVCAPAGYGKTTLVSHWLQEQSCPVVWLTLTDADNEPKHLLRHLREALADLGIETSDSTLNGLRKSLDALSSRFYLVLDDNQALTEPEPLALLYKLFEAISSMHLVVVGRSVTDIPLSRMRVNQDLTEVRLDDLKLTQDESHALLRSALKLELPLDEVLHLHQRTEGWLGATLLAGLPMRRQGDKPVQTWSGLNSELIDYFKTEVLSRFPPDVVDFLLHASLMEMFSERMANDLGITPEGDRTSLLETFLLFERPGSGGPWLQFHPLFAEFLKSVAYQRLPSDNISNLLRRASQWFEKHHLLDLAVQHAVLAEDWENATRLLRSGFSHWNLGRDSKVVRSWIELLPLTQVQSDPQLCLQYGLTLLEAWEISQALYLLERAYSMANPEGPGEVISLAAAGQAWAYSYLGDDTSRALWVGRTLEALTSPPDAYHLYSLLYLAASDVARGRPDLAERYLDRYPLPLWYNTAYPFMLGMLRLWTGHPLEAMTHFQEFIRKFPAHYHKGHVNMAHAFLAGIYLEIGEPKLARAVWNNVCLKLDTVEPYYIPQLYALYVEFLQSSDQQDEALELLRKVCSSKAAFSLDALSSTMLAFRGEHEAAFEMLAIHRVDPLTNYRYTDHRLYEGWLHYWIVAGKPEDWERASLWLDFLKSKAQEESREGELLVLLLSESLLAIRQGDHQRRFESYQAAIELGRPRGYARLFEVTNARARSLLSEASSLHLTSREQSILKMLDSGLSDLAIADELVISPHTVKWYNRRLYRKLGVSKRHQAVQRARKLGLLGAQSESP